MKIGFTGTQIGMTDEQKKRLKILLKQMKATSLSHGDCIGADEQAHKIAKSLGLEIYIHPPIDSSKRAFCKDYDVIYPPKDYLKRNKDIVNESDRIIAMPKGKEELRSGTWATVRYAKKQCKSIIVIYPSG